MVKKIYQTDLDDGLRFDKHGRMIYHPDFHPNKGKPYTMEELEYICKFCDFDGLRSMSFALGRPEASVANMLSKIKREGKLGYYKRLDKYYLSRR